MVDGEHTGAAYSDPFPTAAPLRLLVFADSFGPTQAISFIEGLARARAGGQAAVRIVEEQAFGEDAGARGADLARVVAEAHVERTDPTAVVLSRFGHAAAYQGIVAAARARGLPVVMHIDDDQFELPVTTGVDRYRTVRHPRRTHTLHRALTEADLVIATTPGLADRLSRRAGHGRIGWLDHGAGGEPRPRRPKPAGAPVVIGYMGSASHGPDLQMVIPALNAVAADIPNVRLELFGSIARTADPDLLPKGTVLRNPVAGDYRSFRDALAELEWDIGLAPLHATPYNVCKTPTKWAEYAEAGIAALASDMPVYRPMIEADAAAPAGPAPEQWTAALRRLVASPALRETLVRNADALLTARFGWEGLETRLIGLIGRAGGRLPPMAA